MERGREREREQHSAKAINYGNEKKRKPKWKCRDEPKENEFGLFVRSKYLQLIISSSRIVCFVFGNTDTFNGLCTASTGLCLQTTNLHFHITIVFSLHCSDVVSCCT